jgi:archaetidylinositol phosphate synthase
MSQIAQGELAAPPDVQANQTYVHLAARWFVRPMLGTWIRPNHLTLLRLVIGLVAIALLMTATVEGNVWSGICWVVACFLDRADGELARLGDLRSESGKRLDYYCDLILDASWFFGVGMALRFGVLGSYAIVLGALCCVSMVIVQWAGEMYERLSPPGVKVWAGVRRFHPDDALFFFAVFTWVDVLLLPVLIGSSVVLPIVATLTLFRYRALRARLQTMGAAASPQT